jgi:hypothetical protein
MTLNFATPAQNIVCFDLLNSTWEETYAGALACGFFGFIIDFLKIKYDELHSDQRNQDSSSKIYFEESYIVSCVDLSRHDEVHGIISSIDYELSQIKPISAANMDSKKLMESIVATFYKSENLALNEIVNDELLTRNQGINTEPFYPFESEIINLEVKNEMNLNLEEFSKKFNIKVIFEKHYLKLKTHRFKLASIYYRNQLPIAFSFQYYGKTYIAWNEDYLNSILNIKPINLISLSKTEQLNTILDRINKVGLEKLHISEMEFLETFD